MIVPETLFVNGSGCGLRVSQSSQSTPPAVSNQTRAPDGPIDRNKVKLCFDYTNNSICSSNCVANAKKRGETDYSIWYCDKNNDGKGNKPGLFCCPPYLKVQLQWQDLTRRQHQE